jgi:hypothetical protein
LIQAATLLLQAATLLLQAATLLLQAATDRRQQRQLVGVVQRGGGPSILAVDGHSQRVPDGRVGARLRVRRAGTEKAKSIFDAGSLGKVQGVALAPEEIFQQSEIEQMNSHS